MFRIPDLKDLPEMENIISTKILNLLPKDRSEVVVNIIEASVSSDDLPIAFKKFSGASMPPKLIYIVDELETVLIRIREQEGKEGIARITGMFKQWANTWRSRSMVLFGVMQKIPTNDDIPNVNSILRSFNNYHFAGVKVKYGSEEYGLTKD